MALDPKMLALDSAPMPLDAPAAETGAGGPEDPREMGLDAAAASAVDAAKSGDVAGFKAAMLDFMEIANGE
jgi:hypothetical protein